MDRFRGLRLLGVFYNGLALTTINGLGVILSPADAPGSLPGLNGACFQIGAGLGIAHRRSRRCLGHVSLGYQEAMWISVASVVMALFASLWVRGAAEHAKKKISVARGRMLHSASWRDRKIRMNRK